MHVVKVTMGKLGLPIEDIRNDGEWTRQNGGLRCPNVDGWEGGREVDPKIPMEGGKCRQMGGRWMPKCGHRHLNVVPAVTST